MFQDHPIVAFTLDLIMARNTAYHIPLKHQEMLLERLVNEEMLIEALGALFTLAVKLGEIGQPIAAVQLVEIASQVEGQVSKHITTRNKQRKRMMAEFDRICAQAKTLSAPVHDADLKTSAKAKGSFNIANLHRPIIR